MEKPPFPTSLLDPGLYLRIESMRNERNNPFFVHVMSRINVLETPVEIPIRPPETWSAPELLQLALNQLEEMIANPGQEGWDQLIRILKTVFETSFPGSLPYSDSHRFIAELERAIQVFGV